MLVESDLVSAKPTMILDNPIADSIFATLAYRCIHVLLARAREDSSLAHAEEFVNASTHTLT